MAGRINFRLKLIISYIIVILLSFGFVAFFLDKNLEENSLNNLKNSLTTQAYLIENQISAESFKDQNRNYLEDAVKILSRKAKCRITVIGLSGKVLADSEKSLEEIPDMENHISRPEIKTALSGFVGMDMRYSPTLKINMLYAALPVEREKEKLGVIRLALPVESVNRTLLTIRKTIFIGLLFALGFALMLGFIIAARTVEPINRMIQISRKFSEGEFKRRVVHISRDEIGDLALTLNKMAQDIEDKIKEIHSQNQKLAATFTSMVEGVIITNKEERIISVNPAVENMFEISNKNIAGMIFLEAIRNKNISELIKNVLKTGRPVTEEITLILPVRKVFQVNAAPIFENNVVDGCLVVIHDITEIRKLETMRKDFVANVSHELKTPLTSIKGFIETLLEGAVDDKENNRNFLKIIKGHSERLEKLVDDLLSLSFLESKDAVLEKEDYNMRRQVEELIPVFDAQSKKQKIGVRNELPQNLLARADKDKMDQVFTNLIDNAIKFNKENGYVRIYNEDMGDKIKIIVEDSGSGVPEKDIPRIFERFYRVDKARSREMNGTGLGLSIVKHIIELHSGTVGVESTEGLGSKFWFTLPK